MKRRVLIVIVLVLAVIISCISSACNAKPEEESSVTENNSENESQEISTETESSYPDVITGRADRGGLKTCVTLGCAYKTSAASLSAYPDDGKILTDGMFNALCLDSDGFTGFKPGGGKIEITADLGAVVEGLCDFEIRYMVKSGTAREPASFEVSVSTDGEKYIKIGETECAERTVYLLDRQYGDTLETENAVKGRYIRFTLQAKPGFSLMLQEICAYKYLDIDLGAGDAETALYTRAPDNITVPYIEYSFITTLPLAGCTEADADEYFDNLQNAGLKGLIVLNGAGFDGVIMSESAFETLFAQCEKRGMSVFMGLNMAKHDLYTTEGYADEFLSVTKTAAETIYAKYKAKYPNAFRGWYFNTELNNSVYAAHPEICVKLLNGYIDVIEQIDSSMPMLMSPFTASWAGDAAKLQTSLANIMRQVNFRPIDIYCPQDSVGAELVALDSSDAYLAAAKSCCDEEGINFWVNVENFIIKSRLPGSDDTVPAPLSRFTKQMEIASRYTETLTSFTFEAYSPEAFGNYTIYNDTGYFYEKYLEYLTAGTASETKPAVPDVAVRDAEEGYVYVTVSLKTPTYGLSDLAVTKNGVYSPIGRYLVNAKGNMSYVSYRDKIDGSNGIKYEFKAYDFASSSSASKFYGYKCEIDEVFTCEIDRTLTKRNVALGCAYTGSAPTHSNGDNGGEFTDGIYGGADFSDAAWSGYSDTRYEFIIDLGEIVEGIADFNVSLLGGGLGSIYEPKSITFAVSADGAIYHAAGEVKYTSQGSGNSLYKTSMGLQLELGAAARYVKVTVDCYGWCFIDEMEIYKYE